MKCEKTLTVKIPRDSLYDGPTEIVEFIWANIWCILDWI